MKYRKVLFKNHTGISPNRTWEIANGWFHGWCNLKEIEPKAIIEDKNGEIRIVNHDDFAFENSLDQLPIPNENIQAPPLEEIDTGG